MNKFFTLTFLLPFSTLTMVPGSTQSTEHKKETVSVTESCAKAIEQINHDGPVLYYYLKGSFNTIVDMKREDIKPSDLLTGFADGRMPINDATKLQYMPATSYLQTITSTDFKKFDEFFTAKYNETKDLSAAWKAFRKHFKQEGIAKPFIALKQDIVKADQERQEFAKKGIYFRGNTVIINPNLAQEGAYPEAENQCKQQ